MSALLDALRDPTFRRDVGQGTTDALNRGLVAQTLGAPVDMGNTLLNLGKAGYGYAGHKLGLLKTEDMPQLDEKPAGGSEWFGDLMQKHGMVSGNRNPVAETIAGGVLAPLVGAEMPKLGAAAFKAEENLASPRDMSPWGRQRGAVSSAGLSEMPMPSDTSKAAAAASKATTMASGRARLLREGLDPENATAAAVASAGRPKGIATVQDPQRVAYPGVYDNPRDLVARARVAPEDPAMKQLFGVDRGDLLGISEGGSRQGTTAERPYFASERGKPNEAALAVSNPRNIQRLQDITHEALQRPDLAQGMLPWYVMDPMYQHYVRLWGPERAAQEYNRFNNFTGMSSPSSEVLTELRRGTAANRLEGEGRWNDFVKYGGMDYPQRVKLLAQGQFPQDMMHIPGHMNHMTAHVKPMQTMIENNMTPDMGSAKVPSYITASGVPETGFQTAHPIGDAHFSRIVGLPDTRNWKTTKGVLDVPRASATIPEMKIVGDMFRERVAEPMGVSGVGGQGLVWGAGSHATGVTSPIGAPKLEMISQLIMRTAKRLGVSPEQARDMVIMRKADLGRATPEAMGLAGAGAAGAGALVNALRDDSGGP
jgi:hypothetical protein